MDEPYIKIGDRVAYKLINGEMIVGMLVDVMSDAGQTDGLIKLGDAVSMNDPDTVHLFLFIYERHVLYVGRTE